MVKSRSTLPEGNAVGTKALWGQNEQILEKESIFLLKNCAQWGQEMSQGIKALAIQVQSPKTYI